MSELNRRWSPYNYAKDNPVRFIDPDGMNARDLVNAIWNKSRAGSTSWSYNHNGAFSSDDGQTVSTDDHDDDFIAVNTKTKTATIVRNSDNYDLVYIDGAKPIRVNQTGTTEADLIEKGYTITGGPEGVGDGSFWGAGMWLLGEKFGSWVYRGLTGLFAKTAAEKAAAALAARVATMAERFGLKSGQKALNKEAGAIIENYLTQMRNGTFNAENGAAGFIHEGQTIITEGNHRMNAAIQYALETGDDKFIHALIQNGRFTIADPAQYGIKVYKFQTN